MDIGADAAYGATEWLINNDVNYIVSGWANLGSSNGANVGKFTAAINQTAGSLSISRILFSSNTANKAVENLYYTLDGGKFITSSVHLGNTQDSSQTDRTVTINADFNMLSGQISHYSTSEMTFRDTFAHDNSKTTGAKNNGAFNINFGNKTATYSGYAGTHSAMVFNTATPVIRLEDSVFLKDYEGQAGGFTVRGTGKLYNYATSTITGKISVLDTATLIVGGSDTYSIGGVNVVMAGKMFETASEIYLASGAKFNFTNSSVQKIFAGQTLSGAGQVLASTSANLQILGTLAPASDDGKAGTLVVSGNGTVEMSKDASLLFNLFSADGKAIDSKDKISFAKATTFVEMATGEGLGKIIFDTTQINQDTSFLLSDLFENASTSDWSKFEFGTTEAARVAATFDGLNTINLSIVVSEPSTIAAIFGAFALAFAAYRRRK